MGANLHLPNSPKGRDGKSKYNQGFYNVQNKLKYIGDPTKVIYRSNWEKYFMVFLDGEPTVLKWGCEVITIPYQDEHGHFHRYYPDFYVEMKNKKDPDILERVVIEIKPQSEWQPDFVNEHGVIIPAEQYLKKFSTTALESYEYRLKTFQKNLQKWTKAQHWCEANGLKYKVMTEKYLVEKGIMPDPKLMYKKKYHKRR